MPAAEERARQQILIVDDSALNRAILSEILSGDFQVLEAENGEQCLDLMHEHAGEISLILLDINMPRMDGFEVLNYMNRNHSIEDVPVIMISSEESDEYIRRAYEMGASDYVSRPFDAKVVYQRVLNTIKLYAKQRRLVTLVSDQIRRREKNTSLMVAILSQIVEFRNGESALHIQHIRTLTECVLEWMSTHTEHYRISAADQDIIPLADVYDALTSERCYKKAFSHETATQMILNGECGTFNPVLIQCLQEIAPTLQPRLAEAALVTPPEILLNR